MVPQDKNQKMMVRINRIKKLVDELSKSESVAPSLLAAPSPLHDLISFRVCCACVPCAEEDHGISTAQLLEWKGLAIDTLNAHSREAEDCLAKAVKLDPSLITAWDGLANCACLRAVSVFSNCVRAHRSILSLSFQACGSARI